MALTDSLVWHFDLDETSGSRSDSTGTYTATENGSVGSTTGVLSNAASMSGSTSLAVADTAALRAGDTDFTVAGWVNLASKASPRTIAGKYDTSGDRREWLLNYTSATNRFRFIVSSNGTGAANVLVEANNLGSPSTSTWYFVVAFHDSSANTINISVNDGTVDSVSHSLGVYSGTADVEIGAFSGGLSALMNGAIDELGFWNRILTASEITTLYNGGNGLAYPFAAGTSRQQQSQQQSILQGAI